jgi:iron(III) transport system substrate-binding protein
MHISQRLMAQAAALAALSLVAACGGNGSGNSGAAGEVATEFSKVEELAAKEGELLVYSAASNDVNEAMVAAFNKKYPDIRVRVTRLATGDLKSRFSAETQSGASSADLVIATDQIMYQQNPEWFLPINRNAIPSLGSLPDKYIAERHFALVSSPWVVTINTNMVKTEPTEWKDLASEELVGKGSLHDPRLASDSVLSFWEILMEEYGPDFLATLGKTNKDWFESSVPAIQKVAAGQVGYAAPGAVAHSLSLRESGAPIKVITPTPVVAFTNVLAIAQKAAHPNAAQLFANFLMSAEGQSAICGDQLYMTLTTLDPQGCLKAPEDLRLADPAKAGQNKEQILGAFQLG